VVGDEADESAIVTSTTRSIIFNLEKYAINERDKGIVITRQRTVGVDCYQGLGCTSISCFVNWWNTASK
jgi:hypothetical protein